MRSSDPAMKLIVPLLNSAIRFLSQHQTSLFEEIRWLKGMRLNIEEGRLRSADKAISAAVFTPLLDIAWRSAARHLNEVMAAGVPKSEKAKVNLARKIRQGSWGIADQTVRSVVRDCFTTRQDSVQPYLREGKPVSGYWRNYGDPERCKVPIALLSENARAIYPYILKTPVRRQSGWSRRRHPI